MRSVHHFGIAPLIDHSVLLRKLRTYYKVYCPRRKQQMAGYINFRNALYAWSFHAIIAHFFMKQMNPSSMYKSTYFVANTGYFTFEKRGTIINVYV